MKTKFNILVILALAASLVNAAVIPKFADAAIPAGGYETKGSVEFTDASPTLTAVDPLAWGMFGDVLPARPFLYSVDSDGITITRFNDNAIVGTWPWPDSIWIEMPDGSITETLKPTGGWEPVAMTVSYPTEMEIANRVKEIPDLTPPWTFVYVVMAHSGYEWQSSPNSDLLQSPNVRDTLVKQEIPNLETESSMLVQINVSDPSFSTNNDPVAPTGPHIAGAILGHSAGQPVYDRSTGNVYVGNMPSNSLPAGLASFVSVIHRIPPEVTAEEAEIPGISKPVIRCGPQHPETGIPVGRPQAYACYDPSGVHPINDNEHVGAYGEFEWEFRNLPGEELTGPLGNWLTVHTDLVTGEPDGILYGTPPTTGDWHIEARVHNLDDPYGVFSDWHPIHLLVTPTAEYLPIKAQFAVGVPVAYQLEGTGSCALTNAPAWIDIKSVPGGCVVMGRAPISGEYYNFAMTDFRETGYPDTSIVFSGNVVGAYNFDPLPVDPEDLDGVGISGLAWHQVEKYQDPSTEPPVMTLEFIGVEPTTGQLYQIRQPAGQPQPPNERPAETAIKINTVSKEGDPLPGSGFGEVAVEADRDIYVAAAGGVIKVSGGTASTISLPFQPASLSLDSDLRTAIPLVEPGQEDHGVLWVAGAGNAAAIDTDLVQIPQIFSVPGASSVSVDFPTQYAYVAAGSGGVAIFGPVGSTRPPMEPRIWSSEEITWNLDFASVAPGPFTVMATGDLPMTLELLGELPDGITFVDNGNGTATIDGIPESSSAGRGCGFEAEGDPEGGDPCGDYAFALTATNANGTYAQALGMSVNITPTIDSPDTATFYVGSTSSFTVYGTGYPTPIFFTWDETTLAAAGVQLIDNENGTASLVGTPTTAGTYTFLLEATTGCPPDAQQTFTLIVNPAGTSAPAITSLNTATWEVIGAPFAPDPFTVTSIGSPTPTLSVVGTLPPGVNFIDNGDSTATFGGDCQVVWAGMEPSCLGVLPDNAEGSWTFTISASSTAGTTDQTFTLIVNTATSIMTPPPTAPANLSFEYPPGGPVPEAKIFSVRTLGDTIPYAAVTTADWLKATPESGLVGPEVGEFSLGNLSVSVDPSELAPGTYTGTVLVTSAGTDGPFATALVTLTVIDTSAQGELGIFPGMLRFEYQVNGTPPAVQSILVMSGGVPLEYTVSTGEARWLSAPAGGIAPDIINISVDPRVGAGLHIANLTITSDDEVYGQQTQIIPVTLLKTAGNANLIQVMFGVGSAPEGLAVNLDTHNLFTTSSNAAAEAAEAGGESGAEVELPGPPEPSAVFQIDPMNMTVVGEIIVHSAGEYIGVNSMTGMAYQASQETGEVAAIDGSTNTVDAFIPLTLDGDVYMPYQIAIDEAQNLIYVGGKSPEPEPNALIGPPYGCKAIRELPSDEVPEGQLPELDCWHAGAVFVIDGNTNEVVGSFLAGDDPEGVVFSKATGKVYASNEDDGSVTVAKGAVRNGDGSITAPQVLSTIIHGIPVPGWWQPTCDANNYCGERGQADLWPVDSACHGIDDEAEEADKMAVDPNGNVYIIDDRYRLAKINGSNDKVVKVIAIPGYDCERSVPDDSNVVFRNSANNIAYMALGQGKLYVTSEQNTVSLIDPRYLTIKATITIQGAVELDAITTDRGRNQVYITDESLASLWILKGACANGTGNQCGQGIQVDSAGDVIQLPIIIR